MKAYEIYFEKINHHDELRHAKLMISLDNNSYLVIVYIKQGK